MEYELNHSYMERRSAGMAVAALVLGILGLVMSFCVYPGFIFGSLAIILGLLSRGGEMTTSGMAKAGITLGILAIIISIAAFFFYLATVLNEFDGWENYMDYIERITIDHNDQTYYDYDTF